MRKLFLGLLLSTYLNGCPGCLRSSSVYRLDTSCKPGEEGKPYSMWCNTTWLNVSGVAWYSQTNLGKEPQCKRENIDVQEWNCTSTEDHILELFPANPPNSRITASRLTLDLLSRSEQNEGIVTWACSTHFLNSLIGELSLCHIQVFKKAESATCDNVTMHTATGKLSVRCRAHQIFPHGVCQLRDNKDQVMTNDVEVVVNNTLLGRNFMTECTVTFDVPFEDDHPYRVMIYPDVIDGQQHGTYSRKFVKAPTRTVSSNEENLILIISNAVTGFLLALAIICFCIMACVRLKKNRQKQSPEALYDTVNHEMDVRDSHNYKSLCTRGEQPNTSQRQVRSELEENYIEILDITDGDGYLVPTQNTPSSQIQHSASKSKQNPDGKSYRNSQTEIKTSHATSYRGSQTEVKTICQSGNNNKLKPNMYTKTDDLKKGKQT
ncbi:uncharacterized protein LOC101846196 [Aplysia californica]|uniref:Uncharacterized protein LOC101846196 n=1 Tax=Aplysia californica TaxID=6500 RepID=A0ABM0JFV9_APLCA|nr:uncharacterized protein LOC101846196 [Aplysia californica]XP_012934874.1 uncharacterized protein LOC101846196 [Aplysia californica]